MPIQIPPSTFRSRHLRRTTVRLSVLVFLLGAWSATAETARIDRAASDTDEGDHTTFSVSGLDQRAEIIVDHWGVPHIYAGTHYDAFFVQGFNAARDRLWQIDLWRRKGLGQLAEVLGADYLAQDKASRLFLYRGDMYPEWLAYGSDAKRIAEAFTSGINAYVALTREQPDLLPPEFALLDYEPASWEAGDVVRIRSNGLWRNIRTEVRRARIACQFDLETAALWKVLEPQWQTSIPEGLDPCDIPEAVLDVYNLATRPVSFKAAETAAAEAPLEPAANTSSCGRVWAATTGSWPARAPIPVGRFSPTIRTGVTRFRRCAISPISTRPD